MSAAQRYGEIADGLVIPAAVATAMVAAIAVGFDADKLLDAVTNGVGL